MKRILGSLVRFALLFCLPWRLKRFALIRFYGWELHPTSSIGYSFVDVKMVRLGAGARIGSLSFFRGLDELSLGDCAYIGNLNYFTCTSPKIKEHFSHIPNRTPSLVLGEWSAITSRHYFDCNEEIAIGRFTTIAGLRSCFMTHSIDLVENRQDAKPIRIGDFCFVGTHCVLLGGTRLPNGSILGACSLLNKSFDVPNSMYAGVPAVWKKNVSEEAKYFCRESGLVM